VPKQLTDDEIGGIRAVAAEGGLSLQQIAARYGTSRQHVSRIVRGEQRVSLPEVSLDGPSVLAAVRRLLEAAEVPAEEDVFAATAVALAEKLDSVRRSETAQSAMAAPGLARALADMLAEVRALAGDRSPRIGAIRREGAVLLARELGVPDPESVDIDVFDRLAVLRLRRARRLSELAERDAD
jgi:transcriptional regulator with XRE-family HTH domain